MITAMAGKTVLDFQIEYTVNSNNLFISTDAPIKVSKCDVDWTDTPSTQPDYDTPFDVNRAWPTDLVTDSLTWTSVTPTGTKTISKSQAQIDLVQAWVNNTTNNNGLILGMDNNYYGSFINISSARFWVSYQ